MAVLGPTASSPVRLVGYVYISVSRKFQACERRMQTSLVTAMDIASNGCEEGNSIQSTALQISALSHYLPVARSFQRSTR